MESSRRGFLKTTAAVGSAIAVAVERGIDQAGQGIVVLEEEVGPVRCGVRFDPEGAAYAEFDLPVIAKRGATAGTKEAVAAALSLDVKDIGFENHPHSSFNAGLPYELVPVRNLEAVGRAKPRLDVWREGFGDHSHNSAFVYCRETVGHDNHFHARMFAPDAGIPEDPATGSAVASFAGAVAMFDDLPDGHQTIRVEQGMEMGRASLITLELEMADGAIASGRIGGNAVFFARGTIEAQR